MQLLFIKRLYCMVMAVLVSLPVSVSAEPSSNIVWDSQTRALLNSADISNGASLAEVCTSCHGETGSEKLSEDFPYLHGQVAAATFKQLVDYTDNTRGHGIMQNFATGLSDEEKADISVYYASLPLPASQSDVVPDTARKLAVKGDGPRLLPPCAACHGRKGEGSIVDVPSLAGQNPSYFITTMQAFKEGTRANDIYNRMRIIATSLTDEEINGLASYYSSLGTVSK